MELSPGSEPVPRLTMRVLLRGFVTRFMSLEQGWLRTARELTITPGAMIRRYVEGERKQYANPFAYLVAATVLTYSVQTVFGFRHRMIESMKLSAGESPAQVAFINLTTELMFANLVWVAMFIFIPLALLLRLFFFRSRRNLAEVFVFALYSGGHLAVLGVVLVAATLVIKPGGAVHMICGIGLAIAYTTWASHGFFKGGVVSRTFKISFAWLVSYAILTVGVVIGVVGWVIASGQVVGEDWNLVSATEQGLVPVVERLLEDGADPEMTRNRTALHVAVETDNRAIVDLLIAAGAEIDARDHLGRTPLFLAVARNRTEISRTLREAGADATAITKAGSSILAVAAGRGDHEVFSWALTRGADVNACRSEGPYLTALMVAAAVGEVEMVEQLLESGADPTIANSDGQTALDLARGKKVKELLRAAAKVTTENDMTS